MSSVPPAISSSLIARWICTWSFNTHRDLSRHVAQEDQIDTDESAEVLIGKNRINLPFPCLDREMNPRHCIMERVHTVSRDMALDGLSRCCARRLAHRSDQKPGSSLLITVRRVVSRTHVRYRLAPPITSVFRSQNGVTQCAHEGGVYIRCVHDHVNKTEANPQSEKTRNNSEGRFPKRKDARSLQY